MSTLQANKRRTKKPVEPTKTNSASAVESEVVDGPNLVIVDGHLLIQSLDVDDFVDALRKDREARLLHIGGRQEV